MANAGSEAVIRQAIMVMGVMGMGLLWGWVGCLLATLYGGWTAVGLNGLLWGWVVGSLILNWSWGRMGWFGFCAHWHCAENGA